MKRPKTFSQTYKTGQVQQIVTDIPESDLWEAVREKYGDQLGDHTKGRYKWEFYEDDDGNTMLEVTWERVEMKESANENVN